MLLNKFYIGLEPLKLALINIIQQRRYSYICAGRRFGKTELCTRLLGAYALEHPRTVQAWIAPTYRQSLIAFRRLKQMCRDLNIPVETRNDLMEIKFFNGSEVQFRSADRPDNLRGEGWKFVVMDEAAYIKEEVFTTVVRPALMDNRGSCVFITTPNGLNWFADAFAEAQRQPATHFTARIPTYASSRIDWQEIQELKNTLPHLIFTQEIEAEFVNITGGQYVKPEHLQYYDPPLLDAEVITMGVDLAISQKQSADYTACVVTAFKDKKIFVLYAGRWRAGVRETVERLAQIAMRYNVHKIGIEAVQYQEAVAELMEAKGFRNIIRFKPKRDKVMRFLPVQVQFEQRNIYLPRQVDRAFIDELLVFPDGEHDDFVDALVYAVRSVDLSQKKVAAAFGFKL